MSREIFDENRAVVRYHFFYRGYGFENEIARKFME